MEITPKPSGPRTPSKQPNQSKPMSRKSENLNPNESNSPITKSKSKSRKSASKNPNPVSISPSQKNRIQERKFFVAKSKSRRDLSKSSGNCECKKGSGKQAKCLCLAYESLRVSQEEFLKNGSVIREEIEVGLSNKGDLSKRCGFEVSVIEKDASFIDKNINGDEGRANLVQEGKGGGSEVVSRRVRHLVEAFEKMVSLPKSNGNEEEKDEKDGEDKGTKSVSVSTFCPSDCFLTSESLGLDSHVLDSLESGSKKNSCESSGAFGRGQWKRRQQVKTTAYVPFKLMTEERGKCKEEYFRKKVQHMMEEEEKLRIPLAQALPRTTDEPECLMKPPIKDITTPIDLVLHSDIRAEERADFDHQIAEKMSFIEQYKREKERQQKLAEEEEIRRLRKELVPKAQPMPYFDRPFFPKKVHCVIRPDNMEPKFSNDKSDKHSVMK